ncbi:hypothetical protein GGR50DRAFT_304740 [Xylaria sp. CBS 124048]|nr:hypothetical protein GGR50DRAFT_304740 [Xylaria sp. CBS 124048]
MDDPWGSPWASTDAPSDNGSLPPSQADAFLSPPPRVFFGSASSLSAQSPWDSENDGFGVWTTPDRADGSDSQNDWGVWRDFGRRDSSTQLPRLSSRLSVSRSKSPLTRPENVATSPIIMPRSRSQTPSISRSRSPDPWATVPSSRNRADSEFSRSPNLRSSDTPRVETGIVEETIQLSQTVATSGAKEGLADRGLFIKTDTLNGAEVIGESISPTTRQDLDDKHGNASSLPDVVVRELPSRPSSTFTLDSRDGPEGPDSPITSIDEDRGIRSQNKLQNILESQVLEGKYGGIAQAKSEQPLAVGSCETLRTQNQDKPFRTNEPKASYVAGALGDVPFDDNIEARCYSHALPELSSIPEAELKNTPTEETKHQEVENDLAVTETQLNPSRNTINEFAGITFDTNLVMMDELFAGLTDSSGSGPQGQSVPSGHIINDSFTTISERKAWYRVSRFGSMRKHNLGDDENYVRVAWPTSQLRTDVVKIARRWMEEDLYAGKAIFGGSKRTGFFDWDSDAAPVQLDEVFRRRKSISKHARPASIPANHETISRPFPTDRPYRNSTGISFSTKLSSIGSPVMPIPRFSLDLESKPSQSAHTPKPSLSSTRSPIPPPGSVPASAVPQRLVPIQTKCIDDDDEDWGEMVSSPHVKESIQPSIDALPLSKMSTEIQRPTSQPALEIPKTAEPVEAKSSNSIITQPSSDPRPSSDLSDDKLNEKSELPIEHASQSPAHSASPMDASPARSKLSLEENHKFTTELTGLETPGRNSVIGQTPVDEVAHTVVPTMDATMGASRAQLPRSESQDNLIVQNILRNIPDLSYMLR